VREPWLLSIVPRALPAFPRRRCGRPSRRPFRGLLGVHSRYGPPVRRPVLSTGPVSSASKTRFPSSPRRSLPGRIDSSPGRTLTCVYTHHFLGTPTAADSPRPGPRCRVAPKASARAASGSGHDVPGLDLPETGHRPAPLALGQPGPAVRNRGGVCGRRLRRLHSVSNTTIRCPPGRTA
jgi:hypothetical protein